MTLTYDHEEKAGALPCEAAIHLPACARIETAP